MFSFLLVWVLGVAPALVCACDRAVPEVKKDHTCCMKEKKDVSHHQISTPKCHCFQSLSEKIPTVENILQKVGVYLAVPIPSLPSLPRLHDSQKFFMACDDEHPPPPQIYLQTKSLRL